LSDEAIDMSRQYITSRSHSNFYLYCLPIDAAQQSEATRRAKNIMAAVENFSINEKNAHFKGGNAFRGKNLFSFFFLFAHSYVV
jgi:hypothetical protein